MHCNVLLTAAKTQTKFQTNLALLLRETVLMTVASILIRFYAQIRQTECRARKSSYHCFAEFCTTANRSKSELSSPLFSISIAHSSS